MFKQKADEDESLRGSGSVDSWEEREADGSVLKALKNRPRITGYRERVGESWGGGAEQNCSLFLWFPRDRQRLRDNGS